MSNKIKVKRVPFYVSLSVTSYRGGRGVDVHESCVTYWRRDAKGVGRIERQVREYRGTPQEAEADLAAFLAGPDGHLF